MKGGEVNPSLQDQGVAHAPHRTGVDQPLVHDLDPWAPALHMALITACRSCWCITRSSGLASSLPSGLASVMVTVTPGPVSGSRPTGADSCSTELRALAMAVPSCCLVSWDLFLQCRHPVLTGVDDGRPLGENVLSASVSLRKFVPAAVFALAANRKPAMPNTVAAATAHQRLFT